ncbi:LuxR C-terminal-related transcriptional regulator [Streptomyces sp. NPDC052000]|uniref:response regulator transcription factor n=1 Tax=Streptomyces sp. NPDC052000 TaxID=3155676 RepID=UPI00344EB747
MTAPLLPAPGTPLTARQVQVIVGFARGHTSRQIGFRLGISWETVDTHRRRISAATGMPSRPAIVNHAYEHGYLAALAPEQRPPIALKPRYLDVLKLVALGLGDAAIARRLHLSEGAVRSRITALLRTVDVGDCAHAVAVCWQQGLLGGQPTDVREAA